MGGTGIPINKKGECQIYEGKNRFISRDKSAESKDVFISGKDGPKYIPGENAVTPRLVEPLCCLLGQNTLEKVAATTFCHPLPKRGASCRQDGRGPSPPTRRLPRPVTANKQTDGSYPFVPGPRLSALSYKHSNSHKKNKHGRKRQSNSKTKNNQKLIKIPENVRQCRFW